MRGEVISVDSFSGDGLITGEDGGRYTFAAASTRAALRIGDKVDFVGTDGVATDIIALSSQPSGAAAGGLGYAQPRSGTGAYDFAWAMFQFEGRLRRSHFWISWGILFAAGFVLGLIPIIGSIIGIALIYPQIAVQVKRLHDMGRSGWWVLAPFAANIVMFIVAIFAIMGNVALNQQGLENEDPAAMMAMFGSIGGIALLFLVINLGWLLWIGIADSQPGRNKYGPNPKNPVDDTANTFA